MRQALQNMMHMINFWDRNLQCLEMQPFQTFYGSLDKHVLEALTRHLVTCISCQATAYHVV